MCWGVGAVLPVWLLINFEVFLRASLVPAAAVIPAPMVYANIVAVKKLVVEFLRESILCGLNELQRKMIYLILCFCTVGIRFLIVE